MAGAGAHEHPDWRQNWTLRYELPRPWALPDFDKDRPRNQNLYGYPTIAPINEDEYLMVFTECASDELP